MTKLWNTERGRKCNLRLSTPINRMMPQKREVKMVLDEDEKLGNDKMQKLLEYQFHDL